LEPDYLLEINTFIPMAKKFEDLNGIEKNDLVLDEENWSFELPDCEPPDCPCEAPDWPCEPPDCDFDKSDWTDSNWTDSNWDIWALTILLIFMINFYIYL
jgi:hypothetical protein